MSHSPKRANGVLQRLIRTNARFIVSEGRKWLDVLEAAAPGPPVIGYILFTTPNKEIAMSDIQVTDDSGPIIGTVQFLDAKGNPTEPAGELEWSQSDESVGSYELSDDGKTMTYTLSGAIGASQVTCLDPESDDNGDDDVVCVGTISVVSGKATVGNMELSQPA